MLLSFVAAFFSSYPLSCLIYVCITSNRSVALYSFSFSAFLAYAFIICSAISSFYYYYYYLSCCYCYCFPSWICNSYRNVFSSISSDSLGGVATATSTACVSFFLDYLQLPSSLSILSTETFPIRYCCSPNYENFPLTSYRYLAITPLSVSGAF